jgi:23S rRNA (uracil1939-C5)-methyltransferase
MQQEGTKRKTRKKRAASRGETGPQAAGTATAAPPVKKNERYVVDIEDLTHEGAGVGRVDGFTLFVQGALPGEKALVHVMKVKKQYGYAKLIEVLDASPNREEPRCPVYRQCGGCQLQHWSYDAQLDWKRQLVVNNLERIGKLHVRNERSAADELGEAVEDPRRDREQGAAGSDESAGTVDTEKPLKSSLYAEDEKSLAGWRTGEGIAGFASAEMDEPGNYAGSAASPEERSEIVVVHPTLGMRDPWRYRNKAQVPIGEEQGGLIGGFYAQGSHRIIDTDACLIQHEQNDEVIRQVKAIGRELGISAYNEQTGEGLLRHVVVKVSFHTGELMVVLVTNGERIPREQEWISRIREKVPAVASICQNINARQTNVIFGERTRILWGREYIVDRIGEVQFAISARSFYQVNPVQTEILYRQAVEYAGLTGEETVIDAYCGIGTISLFLARHAKRVYGVEAVPEAVEDARRNAALNGMNNVEFETGLAEEVIPRWKEQGITADVIVVDPPRKGCDAALLDTIIAMRPRRVVYVSCNPSTLARDLRVLSDGGYRVLEVQPVDMFPHTVHVECVVLLVRK